MPEFIRKASLKSFHPFDSRKKNWLLIFFKPRGNKDAYKLKTVVKSKYLKDNLRGKAGMEANNIFKVNTHDTYGID